MAFVTFHVKEYAQAARGLIPNLLLTKSLNDGPSLVHSIAIGWLFPQPSNLFLRYWQPSVCPPSMNYRFSSSNHTISVCFKGVKYTFILNQLDRGSH